MVDQNGHRTSSSQESRTGQRKTLRVLGTLESRLMEVLWKTPSELNVQEVCDALGPGHNYKTVMTVLNRLVEKELLERKLDGRAYRYHPHQTRATFLKSAADDLVEAYLQAYGEEAAFHLSSAVEAVAPRGSGQAVLLPSAGASARKTLRDAAPNTQPQGGVSVVKIILGVALLEGILLIFGRPRRKG